MPTNIWTPKEDRKSLPPTYLVVSVGGAPRDSTNCQTISCKSLNCCHDMYNHRKCQRVSLARQTLRGGSPYQQESISLMMSYSHLDGAFADSCRTHYSHPGQVPFARGPLPGMLSSTTHTRPDDPSRGVTQPRCFCLG